MVGHLTRFGEALRAAGVPVSVADVLDAAQAVRAAGVTERDTFRLALRACLVKSVEHHTPFDRLFEAFFRVPWPGDEPGKRRKRSGAQPSGQSRDRRRPGAQPASDTQRPGAPRPAEPSGAHGPGAKELQERAARDLAAAAARARAEAEQRHRCALVRQPLWRRSTPLDEAALLRAAEALGRRLATRHGRRFRRAAHGRVDLRATVARSAHTGGVPFRVVRRQRRILKPRLLVLCDVSGSVIRSARLLLALLAQLDRLFDGGHAFVFVDRPVPAPPGLAPTDLDTLPGLDLQALSDFGHVFVKLLADHADLLTRRTSLLILGDARCNRFDPQAWALEEIARRVAHVVWLNPERRDRWYTADSRLAAYEPLVTSLLPAATLEDLAAGVARLLGVAAEQSGARL